MAIKQKEVEILIFRMLFIVGGYLVARFFYQWIDKTYGTTTPFFIGIGILLFIAFKYNLRLPYMLNKR